MSNVEDYKVARRIVRLATIARTVANTTIVTKRGGSAFNPESGKTEPTMRDDTDLVGNEQAILSALLRIYLNPSELQET